MIIEAVKTALSLCVPVQVRERTHYLLLARFFPAALILFTSELLHLGEGRAEPYITLIDNFNDISLVAERTASKAACHAIARHTSIG